MWYYIDFRRWKNWGMRRNWLFFIVISTLFVRKVWGCAGFGCRELFCTETIWEVKKFHSNNYLELFLWYYSFSSLQNKPWGWKPCTELYSCNIHCSLSPIFWVKSPTPTASWRHCYWPMPAISCPDRASPLLCFVHALFCWLFTLPLFLS